MEPAYQWPVRTSTLRVSRAVAVVQPRLRGVGVAALLPEAAGVPFQEFDGADPLGALPRVQPWRDHPARSAVLAWQRLSLPGVHEQHVVLHGSRERQIGGVGDRGAGGVVVARAEDVRRLGPR